MKSTDLVRMSTQIAQFFEPYTTEEAITGVAEHLTGFWTPSMRLELLAILATGTPPLHPLVVEAARRLTAGRPA
ncbi:MAG: formate dehydrogenase subunit delta [Gemmatimonadetes bacterium]|nr:formate dehydrogenase subunit delta [Gemmatimonadota bacterium]